MNGPQSILLHNYQAPKLEPLLSAGSLWTFFLNVVTLGIYGPASKLSKEHRIKELKLIQSELRVQIADLNKEWSTLENSLGDLSEQIRKLNAQDDTQLKQCQERLGQIADKNKALHCQEIGPDHATARTVGEIALCTIAFVGQLLANLCTVFLFSTFAIRSLKNEEAELALINDSLRKQYLSESNARFARIDKIVEGLCESSKEKYEFLNIQNENEEIRNTDQGQAYIELQQANQKVGDLETKQKKLETDVIALRIQKIQAERGKEKVEADLSKSEQGLKELQTVKQEKDQLDGLLARKDSELAQKQDAVDQLRSDLWRAQQKGEDVQRLEIALSKANDAVANHVKVVKLTAELGPIAPKYAPRKEDGEIDGAMDLDEDDDEIDAEWKAYASEYKKRYGEDKRSAADIIESSFNYAFEYLIGMAESGDKIKLNRSMDTPATPGAFAVYRYMAYDLLKGGKVAINGCHGYEVMINDNVEMLQSQPEKVMQFKDTGKAGHKPVVIVRHKQCDDFTPPVEAVGQNGVDPVSAKWILEQLTPEEEAHLLNLLLSSVIENSNAEYVGTQGFMRQTNQRVKLVQTAFDLISDMGSAYAKKFGGTVLPKCWQEHVDTLESTLKPFIKPEDVIPDEQSMKIVDWVLDADVIGGKKANDPWTYPHRQDFVDLIKSSRATYQCFFNNLQHHILSAPAEEGKKYAKLTFADLDGTYYLSHQMIGSKVAQQFGDREYDLGGQHCLFSNLLAVLVSSVQALTEDNVLLMRKAMAAYLDKLQTAKFKWANIKRTLQSVPETDDDKEWENILKRLPLGSDKTKELASLASRFEDSIQKTHGCSVNYYQSWLRNEQLENVFDQQTHQWHVVSNSTIKIDNLTPLEIEIAAHAFGVKIGVLPILTETKNIRTDEYGRIVPDGLFSEYYGPNTKEFLLMGATLLKGNPGSYYGLFPKIDLASTIGSIDYADRNQLTVLEAYWKTLDSNRRKGITH